MDKQAMQLTQPKGTDLTARGTGRTSRAIAAALLAAAAGHRVIYVTQAPALEAASTAKAMLNAMVDMVAAPVPDIMTERYAITFYRDGKMIGEVRFCNMNDNPERRNTGLRGDQLYKLVDDHAVAELRAAQALELEKVAAMEQIALLMEKHGWECACPAPQIMKGESAQVTHFYLRDKQNECDVRKIQPTNGEGI